MNTALQALASCSSGPSAPATTYAFQFWADTSLGILKQRNAANTAWISVLVLATGAVVDGSVTPVKLSAGAPTWTALGEFTVIAPALLGYGPGAGGVVTQLTSKATAVTLNKPTGQITMNAAALAAAARVAFTVNNTLADASTNIVLSVAAGSASPNEYIITARAIAGGFVVIVKNDGTGSASDALVIQYSLYKGAIA